MFNRSLNCSWAEILPVPMTYTRDLTTGGDESENPGFQGGGNQPENPGSQGNENHGEVNPPNNTSEFVDHKTSGKYIVTSSGTVTYVGPADNKSKSVTIPDQVTNEKGTFKVTVIADGAFKGNKNISSITIGKNVTKIGNDAFKNCKIKVPASKVKAYAKKFKKKGQKAGVKISK